jgi:hypothetical protein
MPWRFVFDPSQPELRKVLKNYEELALRYFWDERAEDVGSRDVWIYVNEKLGEGRIISRAATISFLKAMDEEGVLESRKVGGKGDIAPDIHLKWMKRSSQDTLSEPLLRV